MYQRNKPKKISAKNVNTVNLGFPFDEQPNKYNEVSNASLATAYAGIPKRPSLKLLSNYKLNGSSTNSFVESSPYSSPTGRPNQQSKHLPGDRVIFAESASSPGVPIVYRLEDERLTNPDKLNLDRRCLQVCPVLEGEENLRLLNLQHNAIERISNLHSLRKLIFLDLYDNNISNISALSLLKSLRVLMLGKNKIKTIENLDDLLLLDVLDLHGNKVSKMENLSHLSELRVLNLAGNEIRVVEGVTGLNALSELNLRRNQVHIITEVETIPSLQRLFLSYNDIKSIDSIELVCESNSLIEVALDGNPLQNTYKQMLLLNLPTLTHLDSKRITDDERRIAYVMARKEDEKRKESDRISSVKIKRRQAINNARSLWDQQAISNSKEDQPSKGDITKNEHYSTCHLAELDNESLNLYGHGSLDALHKNWGAKTLPSIKSIVFKYIHFTHIVKKLHSLKASFPSLQRVRFEDTDICSLNQLNGLSLLQGGLEHLYIAEGSGNPVTRLNMWREYIVYRLKHLKLQTLNEKKITNEQIALADQLFPNLTDDAIPFCLRSNLCQWKNCIVGENVKIPKKEASVIHLKYYETDEEAQDKSKKADKATNILNDVIRTTIEREKQRKLLDEILADLLVTTIASYVKSMADIDRYCEKSFSKFKNSLEK